MIFLKVEDFLVFFLEEAGGEQESESESESGNRPIRLCAFRLVCRLIDSPATNLSTRAPRRG